MSVLDVSKLTISYAGSNEDAVHDLSFSVGAAESVGIVGESGAGKSQTALAIMGLLPANAQTSGSIRIGDTEVIGAAPATLRKLRARKVSMIFQDPTTALNPYTRVGNQLKRILLEHSIVSRTQVRDKCVEMLERVGLPEPHLQYHAFPHQLSGGMRQRVLIAAALIGEPDLIVADEATTALDVTVQAQILHLLQELQSNFNTALLIITHDLGVIAQSCQRLLVMEKGRMLEQGECRAVLRRPAHPHTAKLISAVSRIDAPAPQTRQATPNEKPLLEVHQLSLGYADRRRGRGGEFIAVQEFDMSLAAGETIAVVGESGSGKTSLARSIAGLLPGKTGWVSFRGEKLPWRVERRSRALRRQLQMVFQDPVSSLNPAMRIGRIIAEPLAVHPRVTDHGDVHRAVADMLERVGLDTGLLERYPHELSGGQAQRVAIARALMTEPGVLICDEALAALDGTVRREIIALLQAEQQRSQLSLIMITHDLGVVREMSDYVIVMRKGQVREAGSNEQIFANPQDEYTRALLAAVPTI
jgi:peptide/nickel transport system ATP-binding protein